MRIIACIRILSFCHLLAPIPCQVLEGPVFIREPQTPIFYTPGGEVTVDCVASGIPAPDVQWRLENGTPLSVDNGLRGLLPNGSVIVSPPTSSGLQIRCVAKNLIGSLLSCPIFIKAAQLTAWSPRVSSLISSAEAFAVFECQIPKEVGDWDPEFRWYRSQTSGSAVEAVALITDERFSTSRGHLYIWSSAAEDVNYHYWCEVRLSSGESRSSQSVTPSFLDSSQVFAPKISSQFTKTYLMLESGSVGDIICVAQGNPPPNYRWTWRSQEGAIQELFNNSRFSVTQGVLHFNFLTSNDRGRYICSASNSLGEDRTEINLIVKTKLFAKVYPSKILAVAGQSVSFECTASVTTSEFSWVKDGKLVVSDGRVAVNGTKLVVNSVARSDGGIYQCFAKYDSEMEQAASTLILKGFAPEFTFLPSNIVAHPSASVSLKCSVMAQPPAEVSWYHMGRPVSERAFERFTLSSYRDNAGEVVSYLNVSVVQIQDGGEYSCVAENGFGRVETRASLSVYGRPTVSKDAVSLSAAIGRDLTIPCPIFGYPLSNIRWERENRYLPRGVVGSDMFVFDNGTLRIRSVKKEDHGGYFHCEADDPAGMKVKGKVLITIARPPQIAPFAFPPEMEVGARLQVTCSVFSGDFPLTISWLKDGLQIPGNLSVTEHNTPLASSLLFMEVKNDHPGSYICRASNHVATASFSAVLQVKASPKWILEPSDVDVVKNKAAHLPCFARGYPESRVTWLRIGPDGQSVTNVLSLSKSYAVLGNGSLIVSKALEHHEGTYRCDVENDSKEKLSKTIRLRIKSPPSIYPMPTNLTVLVSSPLVLTCGIEGDLPMTVEWTINGVSVAADRWKFKVSEAELGPKRKRSRLTISSFGRDDAGAYACTVNNQIGRDVAVYRVVAITLPEPPKQLRVEEKTSRSFLLKWDSPFPANEEVEYLIQWQLKGEVTWLNSSSRVNQVKVNGLLPARTYLVKVSSRTNLGSGVATEMLSVSTLLEAPSMSPSNVQVSFATERSLKVRWKALANETELQLLGYIVRWNSDSAPQKRIAKSVPASSVSLVLKELQPSTRYGIAVSAFNSEGVGPESEVVAGLTQAEDVFPVVEDVQCVALSSQSLRIKWRTPDGTPGAGGSYRVYYRKRNAQTGPETKRSSNLETVLHGLEPATVYSVRVAVASKSDVGQSSKAVTCRTKEEAPHKVEVFVVTPSGGGVVNCLWIRPRGSEAETVYKLHYRLQGSDMDSVLTVRTPGGENEVSHYVSGLQIGAKYDFWVQALSSYGDGAPSSVVTAVPTVKVRPKIISRSHSIRVETHSSVSLPCRIVGAELIAANWYFGSQRVKLFAGGRISKNGDNELIIREASRADSGNYTCKLESGGTSEMLIHQLEVFSAPSSPVVVLKLVTEQSVSISWTLDDDGGSAVTGFILLFRKVGDSWEEIEIEPFRYEFVLKDLTCGAVHELKIRAANDFDVGPPSSTLMVNTLGNVPEPLFPERLLHSLKGEPHLLLYNWMESGCPIRKFVVKAKQRASAQWASLYDIRVPATLDTIDSKIPGAVSLWLLNPKQHELLQIIAVSDAGTRVVDFEIVYRHNVTTALAVLQNLSDARSAQESVYGGLDLQTLIPIACGVVTTVACISLCIIFVYLRRMGVLSSSGATKTPSETVVQRNSSANPFYSGTSGSEEKLGTGSPDDRLDGEYEINPYATFNLMDMRNQWTGNPRDSGTISTSATIHDTLPYGNISSTLQSNPPAYRTFASYGGTQIHNWDSDDSHPYVRPSDERKRQPRYPEPEGLYQEGIAVISQTDGRLRQSTLPGCGTLGTFERKQGLSLLDKKGRRQLQRNSQREEYSINV